MDRLEISTTHSSGPPGSRTVNAPFPPPVPAIAPVPKPSRRTCAGFWRRFLALSVDLGVLALPFWLGQEIIGRLHELALAAVILDAGGITASHMEVLASLARMAFSLGFPLAYFVLFETSSRAATPGKRLLGFQVRTTDGGKAGFGRLLLRNSFKVLSAAPFMAGFALAMFSPRRRTLHDLLTGSVMVKTQAFPPSGPPVRSPSRS